MLLPKSSNQHRLEKGARIVLWGIAANVFLAAAKFVAGILGHSYALVADGIESVMDVFSSMVVLGGIRISSLPADENHPYGHGKAESLAGVSVSLLLVMAGIGIAVKGGLDLLRPHHIPAMFTLIVLVTVIAIKEIMFRRIFSVGESINSISIKTDAWHHRSDALTSIAAFIGISIAIVGGKAYASADDWAAIAASGLIIFNGLLMLRQTISEIMDYAPGNQTEESIRKIAAAIPGVAAIEKCRVRKSGITLFVDIHVEVNGEMPVHRAHAIAHDVKDALLKAPLAVADVLVHIEPAK